MACTYIIYSPQKDLFYVGSCLNFHHRIIEHNEGAFEKAFTKRSNDWTCYFLKEDLSKDQARFLESFIKKMRNRNFYNRLKADPEIADDILRKMI